MGVVNKVAIYLNRQISGNVFDKDSILEAYSTDRSVLKLKPRFVAIPESSDDIKKLTRFINQLAIKNYKLPIAIRGSGLDTTGGDLTSGLVISTEKLNRVKEVDAHDRLVHVEAGVTLGQLNSALAAHGLMIPVNADPRETIGGLIANYSTDSFASYFGGMLNYVDRMEIILASGDTIQTAPMSTRTLSRKKSSNSVEGSIYRDISRTISTNKDIITSFRDRRDFSGYPSIVHCYRKNNKIFDLFPLFFGSQGTLGIITEIILRAEVIPPTPKHFFATFGSFRTMNEFLYFAKKLKPLELNFYDLKILTAAEKSGKTLPALTHHPDEGYLVYASFGDNSRLNKKKIEKCLQFLPKSAHAIAETPKTAGTFKNIFNSLASYLNDNTGGERTPIISNVYVPATDLSDFVYDLHFLEEKYKVPLPLYGSYATSIYSVRPDIQIHTNSGRRFIVEFLSDFNKLLKMHDGSLAGGSPEGRLKALFTNHDLDPDEKKLFKSIKETFDPNKILAPDIKLGADPRTTSKHFRSSVNPTIIT